MEKYQIFAFLKYGVFICTENEQSNNDVFLIGKFNGKGKEYTFIKNNKDVKI